MTRMIGDYRLVTEFSTAGGGQSQWAFAERKSNQYFIKEFLSPKYPVNGAPGSEDHKRRQRAACERFEKHHRSIMRALAPLSTSGGNLVVAVDFFRNGPRYYKVTEKVDVTDWAPEDVRALHPDARLLLMLTVAHSLMVLHGANLVHGDIKPPNILIKETERRTHSTKLIDFDNAVIAGETLPPAAELVGDMAYYSPELVEYLNGDDSVRLSTASDIFALGLVYSEWLTGAKPRFDPDAKYAGVAVARGEVLDVGAVEDARLRDLLGSMLQDDETARPTARVIHETLRKVRGGAPAPTGGADPDRRDAPKLRGSLAKRRRAVGPAGDGSGAPETTDEAEPPSPEPSKLRGRLARKPR
jgi:eukaryotic-like serine/threonine-protein kinase